MGDVDDRGRLCVRGVSGIWELFVLSSQFCCEPKKIALNNKAFCLKDLKHYDKKIKHYDIRWFLLKVYVSTDQYAIFHKSKKKIISNAVLEST